MGEGKVTRRKHSEMSEILAIFWFLIWMLSVHFIIVIKYSYHTYAYLHACIIYMPMR